MTIKMCKEVYLNTNLESVLIIDSVHLEPSQICPIDWISILMFTVLCMARCEAICVCTETGNEVHSNVTPHPLVGITLWRRMGIVRVSSSASCGVGKLITL